jgi:DUF971 family protein
MSQSALRAVKIKLNREIRQIEIAWSDQHLSVYPLDGLREACPCAECRGGHAFMGADHDPDLIELKPSRSYEVRDMQVVGNYALQFSWSDGHTAGIYSWQYLRRICPCQICREERKTDQRS